VERRRAPLLEQDRRQAPRAGQALALTRLRTRRGVTASG
jgi:hypothetical protein